MHYGEQAAIVTRDQPLPPGFLNQSVQSVEQINKRLDDIRGRLGRLADRVFGEVPATKAERGDMVGQVFAGAAGSVAAAISQTVQTTNEIEVQLNRLEELA